MRRKGSVGDNPVYTLRRRNAKKRNPGRLVVSKVGEAYGVRESEIQIGNSD
jgi:hypothetical protein